MNEFKIGDIIFFKKRYRSVEDVKISYKVTKIENDRISLNDSNFYWLPIYFER